MASGQDLLNTQIGARTGIDPETGRELLGIERLLEIWNPTGGAPGALGAGLSGAAKKAAPRMAGAAPNRTEFTLQRIPNNPEIYDQLDREVLSAFD